MTGELRWEYRRDLPDDIDDYVNGSMTNRNIAIYGNRVLDTSADNYLYALDAETGRLAWETQTLDYLVNLARHSSGLIVAGGKAISSRSCRPHGGPEACVIIAHDAGDRRLGLAAAPRCRRRASRATRPGAASRSRNACTSVPG